MGVESGSVYSPCSSGICRSYTFAVEISRPFHKRIKGEYYLMTMLLYLVPLFLKSASGSQALGSNYTRW